MNKRKQKKIAKKIYELCEKSNIATPINVSEIFCEDETFDTKDVICTVYLKIYQNE